jgi:hypothetical protein
MKSDKLQGEVWVFSIEGIMSNQNDVNHRVELRDEAGRNVGFDPIMVDQSLAAECDRLREELARVKKERDELSQALDALIAEHPFFAPERLAELEKNGLTFRQIMDEIEPLIHGSPNG